MRSRWVPWFMLLACGDDGAATPNESSSSGGNDTTTTTSSSTSSSDGSGVDTSSSSTGEIEPPPPACGSFAYEWRGMLAGPSEPEFDDALEQIALRHDRMHVAITARPTGLAGDISIAIDDQAARDAITTFADGEQWSYDGEGVAAWQKATGAFAGLSAAADAYRYGTLRDQGYPCEDLEIARAQLVRAISALHLVTAVTGEPGLVARSLSHRDFPGASEAMTTPLFDDMGNPLPPEKTNGTFRDDASGEHPEIVWEDGCSRDQIIGWAIGIGAVFEVIRADDTFDPALLEQLRADASAIAHQLMIVRDSGYDLEIWDPDGRVTPNGFLNEHNIDGNYVGFQNGQHAIMSAGIIAALAYAADDPEVDEYLATLLGDRNLVHIAATALLIDFGAGTNYSNYNMAFSGLWLAARYIDDADARAELAAAAAQLYRNPGYDYHADLLGQSFFDFTYAIAIADASARADTMGTPDEDALAQGVATLHSFPAVPAWDFAVTNCDDMEIADGTCTLDDGTVVEVLGAVGHNDALVVDTPIALATRPPSNFYWRSNPYEANGGGDGTNAPSSSDFRFAYWIARWSRR
ncbi:MAG TPA: hypothetical protein VG755_08885 [Nannocystaceae bacterium]|nr:hypothetical protein [Nannocystaceae bacterium]